MTFERLVFFFPEIRQAKTAHIHRPEDVCQHFLSAKKELGLPDKIPYRTCLFNRSWCWSNPCVEVETAGNTTDHLAECPALVTGLLSRVESEGAGVIFRKCVLPGLGQKGHAGEMH